MKKGCTVLSDISALFKSILLGIILIISLKLPTLSVTLKSPFTSNCCSKLIELTVPSYYTKYSTFIPPFPTLTELNSNTLWAKTTELPYLSIKSLWEKFTIKSPSLFKESS